MSEPSRAPEDKKEQHQRKLKNFLLDRHFQLKYAGYLMLMALVIGGALGLILLRTSEAVVAQSHEALRQGELAVEQGQEVLAESEKVSAVVTMNIVKDPAYGKNPALKEAFASEAAERDSRLAVQQRALKGQAHALKAQSESIRQRQDTLLLTIFGGLVLLVIAVGLGGIVVTHRVAGPIFKMKRQIRSLGDGNLEKPDRLRRGDELVDFFQTFNDAVDQLRARQEAHIAVLGSAVAELEQNHPVASRLQKLKDELQQALGRA